MYKKRLRQTVTASIIFLSLNCYSQTFKTYLNHNKVTVLRYEKRFKNFSLIFKQGVTLDCNARTQLILRIWIP